MTAALLFLIGISILLLVFSIWSLFGAIARIQSMERKIGLLAARLDALKKAQMEREKESELPTRKVMVWNGTDSYTMEVIDTGFDIPLDFPNDTNMKEGENDAN